MEEVSRPLYERGRDLREEEKAIEILCRRGKLAAHKLPRRYEIDYLLLQRGGMYGWAEVKVRPGVERYDSFMLSCAKVMAGRRLAEVFGGRFIVVVRRTDDLMVLDALSHRPDYVAMGGRTDRGDDQDMEPVAHYRWDQMSRIDNVS